MDPVEILVAEDNEDDVILIERAFKNAKMLNRLHVVKDGVEVIGFLRKEAGINPEGTSVGLILLDINMPRNNGFKVLNEIKADPSLTHIPVVILTTSDREEDVIEAFREGACSYVTKPVDFESFKSTIEGFDLYWTLVSRLPRSPIN